MKEIICSVLGISAHRLPFGFNEEEEKCESFKRELSKCLIRLIENEHITKFISGSAPGTELYTCEIILDLKRIYPYLSLECVIPYEEEAAKWAENLRDRYFNVLKSCTSEKMLQRHFSPDCRKRKLSYMVDSSDTVLTFSKETEAEIKERYNKNVICLDTYKNYCETI